MQPTLFQETVRWQPRPIICNIPKDDRITDVDFDNLNSYPLPDLQTIADQCYEIATGQHKTPAEKRDARRKYNAVAEAANKLAGFKMYLIIR